jgi:hypothetical protein
MRQVQFVGFTLQAPSFRVLPHSPKAILFISILVGILFKLLYRSELANNRPVLILPGPVRVQ